MIKKSTHIGSTYSDMSRNNNAGLFEQSLKFDYSYEVNRPTIKLGVSITYIEEDFNSNTLIEIIKCTTTFLIEIIGDVTATDLYLFVEDSVEKLNNHLGIKTKNTGTIIAKAVCPTREAMENDLQELVEALNRLA